MIKFAACRNKNTAVGYTRIIVISIKRETAATENRIPDNINRIISWKSPISIYDKNHLLSRQIYNKISCLNFNRKICKFFVCKN